MTPGLIFEKTSTDYGVPDIEYLDETSEIKLNLRTKKEGVSVESLRASNDKILSEIDYLTKEDHGLVYAGGYIRDMLLSKRDVAPEKWDNTKRKKAIASVLSSQKKYDNSLGHKIVFSVSTGLQEKVERAGLNLDQVLATEYKRVLRDFQKKFHKGEKIGYAWGIHHDTDNRHIHIYLSKRTNKGTHVAMSTPLKSRRDIRGDRKNQMGYVNERLLAATKRIEAQVEKANRGETRDLNKMRIKQESVKDKKEYQKIKSKKPFEFKSASQDIIDKQHRKLIIQKNNIEDAKEQVSSLYHEYNLRKKLIKNGYESIKEINDLISTEYSSLKKIKTSHNYSLFNKVRFGTSSAALRIISQFSQKIMMTKTKIERDKAYQSIVNKKELKKKVEVQVKMLTAERNRYMDELKKIREANQKRSKDFYKNLNEYRRKVDQKRFSDFMNNAKNLKLKNEYFSKLKSIKEKKNKGQDISVEKEYLKHLNLYVERQSIINNDSSSPVKNNDQDLTLKKSKSIINNDSSSKKKPSIKR